MLPFSNIKDPLPEAMMFHEINFNSVTSAAERYPKNDSMGRHASVTVFACALMVLLFIGLSAKSLPGHPYFQRLLPEPVGIWTGSYWALITSAFLHQHFWHLGLNVVAFWIWARPVERVIGASRMTILLASSAFVSSVAQLAMFDSAGIGASGMWYAVFGFGWLARAQNPSLRRVFTTQALVIAMTWLLAGLFILTHEIGNGAHIGGLIFGVLAAEALVRRRRARLPKIGLAIVCMASVVIAIFCPWSANWWAAMGYLVHERGRYELAADLYRTSLELHPNSRSVMRNLALAEIGAGQFARASSTVTELKKFAPTEAAELEAQIREGSMRDAGQ